MEIRMRNRYDFWVAILTLSSLGLTSLGGAIGGSILAYHGIDPPAFLIDLTKSAAQILGLVAVALYGKGTCGNGDSYTQRGEPTPPTQSVTVSASKPVS